MILLDTQTLVWHDGQDRRLGARARYMIYRDWRKQEVAVSAFSFWEIMMNRDNRELRRLSDIREWRTRLIRDGLIEIPVDGEIAIEAGRLSGMHGDPGDRIIVATAARLNALLITSDEQIMRWTGPVDRHYAYD